MNKYNLIIPTEGSYYQQRDLDARIDEVVGDLTDELFDNNPNVWISRVEWAIDKKQADFKADLSLKMMDALEDAKVDISCIEFTQLDCLVNSVDFYQNSGAGNYFLKDLSFKNINALKEYYTKVTDKIKLLKVGLKYLEDCLNPCLYDFEVGGGYTGFDFKRSFDWDELTIDMSEVVGLAPYDLKGLFNHILDVEGNNFSKEDKLFFTSVYDSVTDFQKTFLDVYYKGNNTSDFNTFNLNDYPKHVVVQYIDNIVYALDAELFQLEDFVYVNLPKELFEVIQDNDLVELCRVYELVEGLSEGLKEYRSSLDGRSTYKSKRRKLEKLISDFNKQFQ